MGIPYMQYHAKNDKVQKLVSTSFFGEESRPCKVPDVLLGGCVTYEAGNDKFLNFFTQRTDPRYTS